MYEHQLHEVMPETAPENVFKDTRGRPEDFSSQVWHRGTLWKFNVGGLPNDPSHWLERDMWVTAHGSRLLPKHWVIELFWDTAHISQ